MLPFLDATMSLSSKTCSSGAEKRSAPADNDESSTHSSAACLDCRSRKVKCNRELPKCSNCKRSGVPCHFPNPEKKASQMKQLAEDVAQFNGRLCTIEKTLVNRMQELSELVTQSLQTRSDSNTMSRVSSHRSLPQTCSQSGDSDIEDDDLPDSLDATSRRPSSIIVADGPEERFYGPCSTYSHMIQSRGLVEKFLGSGEWLDSAQMHQRSASTSKASLAASTGSVVGLIQDNSPLLAELRRRYDSFSGPANYHESFELGDDRPLELPPRRVLEEAIEHYTSEYSLEPPLFHKQTLLDALTEQYSIDSSEIDESWALCFNNIILRSSAWMSRALRFNSFATHTIDTNVLHALLSNANRALRQLERFCVPRLVNVQALLLLAFVGRDFIHYNVFARIFGRVCQLAKQMGLHERDVIGGESGCAEEREAQNVLWILYAVDKQSIFIRGPTCRIYEFECHLQLPSAETLAQQLVRANLQLNCLIEEVYRYLHSPKAAKTDSAMRQRRVQRLDGRLSGLAREVEGLTSSAEGGYVERAMALHLKYAFHVTSLLILSHSSEKQSKQIRRDTARSALQTIQALCEGSLGLNSGVVVLERLFCDYSVIAFHEVFESVMTDNSPSTLGDVELLKNTTRTLKMISQSDRPYSYCTRLHKNFVWCTEIAILVSDTRRYNPPATHMGGSPSADDNSQVSNGYSASPQRLTPPPSLGSSSNRISPPRDLGGDVGDVLMEDGIYGNLNPTPTTLNAIGPYLTSSEFANLQSALGPQQYMYNGCGDFGPSGHVTSSSFATPLVETSPKENLARLQEALDYILNVRDGFGGTFQQTAPGGDGISTMHHDRNTASTTGLI